MLNKEQTDFLLVNAYNAAIRAGARIIDIYTGAPISPWISKATTPRSR